MIYSMKSLIDVKKKGEDFSIPFVA